MYQVLGTGRTAKLLLVAPHAAPRAITTAPAETLTALINPLERLRTMTLGAITQAAALHDGNPVPLRRTLLAAFDAAHQDGEQPTLPTGHGVRDVAGWVAAAARACQGLPEPVVAAVRGQVGERLRGLDGVLVHALIASPAGWRPPVASLVISPALHELADDDWADILQADDDPLGVYALNVVADDIVAAVYDQYDGDTCVEEVVAHARAQHMDSCDVEVSPPHLVAWLTAHRPHLLELLPGDLTGATPPGR